MNDLKLKDNLLRIKVFFVQMPKKRKIILAAVGGGVIALAIALTLFLNSDSEPEYRVLYSNITTSESSEIYMSLLQMGADPVIDENGDITVPSNEYDIWILQLAAQGYPRSAPAYDIFASFSGMTTTEFENRQWLLFQLQENIAVTLSRMEAVSSAVVTINVPETSSYVWDQISDPTASTAGVVVNLQPDVTLQPEQVSTIKNLVAASVPQLSAENVVVVDAATTMELSSVPLEEEGVNSISISQNYDFERQVASQLEDNVERLLQARYGEDGVVAVAQVTINYDKMITEQLELVERPLNEDGTGGGGFITDSSGAYTGDGDQPIGDIVGEENNTDIPVYQFVYPDNTDEASYLAWDVDVDYSYIKTQIEHGNAILERATISVMVDEDNMSPARQQELTSLVSTSVDIPAELIFVSQIDPDAPLEPTGPDTETEPEPEPEPGGFFATLPLWVLIAAGGGLLLIIAGVVVLIILLRRKKRKKMLAALELEESERLAKEAEIANYKKELSDAALAASNAKEDAIVSEVKEFAQDHPEITANLLRSWIREDN